MDDFSITQNGKPLYKSQYIIDLKNKVFLSTQYSLVLDFGQLSDWKFKVSSGCTFKTGNDCTFDTGGGCTFKTGCGCTFTTKGDCMFRTGAECTFITSFGCIFKTGMQCTFTTTNNCTFNTANHCTFKTDYGCTFVLWDINTCKFEKYDGYSIILDRKDTEAYKLTKEFIALQKIKNN